MKFKIIKLLIIIIVLHVSGNHFFAQTISEGKQKILTALEGNDYFEKVDAILNVSKYQLFDLMPKVEEIMWKNDRMITLVCLRTLDNLNSPNIIPISHKFIEVIDTMYEVYPPLEDISAMKYEASVILIEHNDFSKVNLIFEFIERKRPKIVTNITDILIKILENVPEYAEQAKSELFKNANTLNDKMDESYWSLNYIADTYREETISIMTNVFKNHIEVDNRFLALKKLDKIKYSGLELLLKERLLKDNELPFFIASKLISRYACPINFNFIKSNINNIIDITEKENIEVFILEDYTVQKSTTDIPMSSLIDSLLSYTNQSLRLGWIDNSTSILSSAYLNEAKTFLSQNDLNNTASRIKYFRNYVDYELKDSTNITPQFVNREAWGFLYCYAGYILNKLPSIPQSFILNLNINGSGTVEKNPSLAEYDSSASVTLTARPSSGYIFKEWTGDITGASTSVSVVMNSNKNITASFVPAQSGVTVKLLNSSGALLTGGTLQYYEGAWKDAINNNDGTFTVNTTRPAVSLRMTYEYGSQTKQNVPAGSGDIIFRTVNAQVKLQDSNGNPLDGTVQYYAGAWRSFGSTVNGTASKELLPANYSFRMTYAFAGNDKQQDIGANPVVVFRTVNAEVQLKDSQGRAINQGSVHYYSGAWREFGPINNGSAYKELLPDNYSFRMTYEYASTDKQQNLNDNPVVVFQTINAQVELKNSQGNLIDAGTVQYYAGAWRAFGVTSGGTASKELLPGNYSFRMMYEYISNDKQQDISTNNTVSFTTVLSTIRVRDVQNNLVNNAQVNYYSGAWRVIGSTVNGEITKELLPAEISFRAKLGTKQTDKKQNIGTNSIVEISLP